MNRPRMIFGGGHEWNIPVAVDNTDHLYFVCPWCNVPMGVKDVFTQKTSGDSCTKVLVSCDKCGRTGVRKFYWNKPTFYDLSECAHLSRTDHNEADTFESPGGPINPAEDIP